MNFLFLTRIILFFKATCKGNFMQALHLAQLSQILLKNGKF